MHMGGNFMTQGGDNDPQGGKGWIALSGTALALVLLGLVAVAGAGAVMMMM